MSARLDYCKLIETLYLNPWAAEVQPKAGTELSTSLVFVFRR